MVDLTPLFKIFQLFFGVRLISRGSRNTQKKNPPTFCKLVTNFYEKKVLTVMVNNATNINKANNHHSLNTQNDHKHLRIDHNFYSVHEEITSIRLYTPGNPRSSSVCTT